MADESDKSPGWKQGLRWALIPLLLGVLLIAVLWPESSGDRTNATPAAAVSGATDSPSSKGSASTKAAGEAASREFPEMALPEIVQHDPFSLPPTLARELNAGRTPSEEEEADEERERIEAVVENLQQQKLNVVFREKGRGSAVLGDRVVREGDEIEPGIRILRITPQGLTLEVSEPAGREVDED